MAGSLPHQPGKRAELRTSLGERRAGPAVACAVTGACPSSFTPSPASALSLTAVTVTFVKHNRTCHLPQILQEVSKSLQNKFKLFDLAINSSKSWAQHALLILAPVTSLLALQLANTLPLRVGRCHATSSLAAATFPCIAFSSLPIHILPRVQVPGETIPDLS